MSASLTVYVLDGIELASKDSNGFSDPYCVLFLLSNPKEKQKTKYIAKTLNPSWGEIFTFEILDESDKLVLECWDRDFVGSDNFMGQFQIPVADLISEMKEEYYHLQERPGKKEHISGKIRLQTGWKSAEIGSKSKNISFLNAIPESDRENLSKGEIQRLQVVYELISTEEQYVKDLIILRDSFLEEIENKNLLKNYQIFEIFSNLKQIIPINQALVDDLLLLQKSNPLVPSIGDCILFHAGNFKSYVEYCSNQSNATTLLEEYTKAHPAFGEYLNMPRMECRGLSIQSFIVKPLQRLVKYPLLMRELQSAIPDHPDIPKIQETSAVINEIIKEANNQAIKKELLRSVVVTHRLLENSGKYNSIIKFNDKFHYFIYSSKLNYIKDEKTKVRTAILFNDMLVIAGIKKNSQIRIYFCSPLLALQFIDLHSGNILHAIEVVGVNTKFRLEMHTSEEKAKWLNTTHKLQLDLFYQQTTEAATAKISERIAKAEALATQNPKYLEKVAELKNLITKQREKRVTLNQQKHGLLTELERLQVQNEILNKQVIRG